MTHSLSDELRELADGWKSSCCSGLFGNPMQALRRAADALDQAQESAEQAHELRRENLDNHIALEEFRIAEAKALSESLDAANLIAHDQREFAQRAYEEKGQAEAQLDELRHRLDAEADHIAELCKVHDSDTETLLEVLRERDELRRQLAEERFTVQYGLKLHDHTKHRAECAEARVAKLEDALRWYSALRVEVIVEHGDGNASVPHRLPLGVLACQVLADTAD